MDPLRCLRNFYTENRIDEVKIVDGRVSFGKGEYEFSGDIKTNFLSSINKQPYALAQLLLYIQNWDKPHSEYAKLALKAHTAPVYTADKQKLRAYLKGEQELDAIDDAQLKRPLEEGEEDGEIPVKKEAPKKYRRQDIEGNLRTRENLLVLSHKDFSNCLQVYAAAEKVYTAQLKIQQDGKAKNAMPAKSSRMDRHGTQSTKQQQKLDVKIYGDGAAAGVASQKKKPAAPPASRQSTGSKHTHGGTPMQPKQIPIIVVPESDSAIVSLFNAKQLLQDGEFVPSEQTAALKAGEAKPPCIVIKRPTSAGKHVKFEIRDKVPRDGSKNWERVVAIVCSGKLWQFKKGYPFSGAADGDLMDTFTHLCGFFFYYGGDAVPDIVKSWNVKSLPLNRSQRHGDVQTVQTFFDTLTAFLDSRVRGRDGKYKKGQLCKPDKLAYK